MTYLGICNVGRGSDIQALQRDHTGGYQGQEARGWAQGRTGFGRSEPRARLCGSRLVDVVQPAAILDAVETPDDPPPKPVRPSGEEDRQASPDTRGLVHIIPGVGSLQAGVLGSHTLGCGFYRLGN